MPALSMLELWIAVSPYMRLKGPLKMYFLKTKRVYTAYNKYQISIAESIHVNM